MTNQAIIEAVDDIVAHNMRCDLRTSVDIEKAEVFIRRRIKAAITAYLKALWTPIDEVKFLIQDQDYLVKTVSGKYMVLTWVDFGDADGIGSAEFRLYDPEIEDFVDWLSDTGEIAEFVLDPTHLTPDKWGKTTPIETSDKCEMIDSTPGEG